VAVCVEGGDGGSECPLAHLAPCTESL
jgi:hypothetical protein